MSAGTIGKDFKAVRVSVDGGVATAVIDNPPINLMTGRLFRELEALGLAVADSDDVAVLVLRSANPDFFIAHFDVNQILKFPAGHEAERSQELTAFHQMCERYRSMATVTICAIAGRVGGGGSELAASCDMRFGVSGRAVVNQMEVPIGILPGGTGTQRLPRLVGRGRALEIILGGIDLDADTAERWGYLNRAFPSEAAMFGYVDDLARRIAGYPPEAVALAKEAVQHAEPSWHDGLVEEAYLFERLLRTEEAEPAMRRFLELGGQTPDGERHVGDLNARIGADEDAGPGSG